MTLSDFRKRILTARDRARGEGLPFTNYFADTGDVLPRAKHDRMKRLAMIKATRAYRAERDAKNAAARADYSPAWRDLLDRIDRGESPSIPAAQRRAA